MSAAIVRADARSLPLPAASVDLIVTSPPYFGLRSYTDGGEHYDGQIGSEETPREWLAALLDCTREWMRVLKPGGSIFVNLGDTYAAGHGGSTTERGGAKVRVRRSYPPNPRERPDLPDPPTSWSTREARVRNIVPGIPVKSLSGMPWRYAIGCVDDLGLILRAEIIWAKPNGLPESVTDRVRRSHEQVFHFTKQPRYFAAVDEIRQAHARSWGHSPNGGHTYGTMKAPGEKDANLPNALPNPLGKLPGSVWEIPSAPLVVPAALGVDHFAAYPCELPRRIILGWSPSGICVECGEGRRPVAATEYDRQGRTTNGPQSLARRRESPGREVRAVRSTAITGYACACPDASAPARPAVVADPFGGTGTTALVATMLGRHGVSFDLSADYCRLATWRTRDPAERARALGVPKPPPIPDGMEPMFEMTP